MLEEKMKHLKKNILWIACCFALGACSSTIKSTPEYNNPPAALKEKMKSVMPNFEPWVYDTEKKFSTIGEALKDDDLDWAKRLNIKNIDNIRIVKTEFFPMPQDSQLLSDLEFLGWGSPAENARNMGYTIFIRPDQNEPKVRAEQIALVYLMEGMGRTRFLYRSLVEQRSLDAPDQPLLIEAKKLAKCAVINGKVAITCSILGTKPQNHKEFEKARQEAEKIKKSEKDKQDKVRKEFEMLQKDNLMLQDIKNEKIQNEKKQMNLSSPAKINNAVNNPISSPYSSFTRDKIIDKFIIK